MAETKARTRERRSLYEDGFRVLRGRREFVTYPEDASLRVWYSDVPWRYDLHQHSAVEILLTLEGHVDYQIGEQSYRVEAGEILIIPPEVLHGLSMGENSSRLLFLFEMEPLLEMRDIKKLGEHFNKVFHLHDGSETHEEIRKLLNHVWAVYQQRELLWNSMCFSDLVRMYSLLGQKYLSGIYQHNEKESPAVDRQVISSAMSYIDQHYRENVTLEDLADFTGFSRFYFSRSFKQQTGHSFRGYLSQRRIQVAMELLIRTDKSMAQVAEESGFGSVASFNRAFREYKSCTPSQYRAIYGEY
ncbi:MAG: helix-turn-helix transcriptional regulator [Clostridia bacterium]|nr:helix-turn-helix transcriptional regulator [Clostridia bacterium]